jgi:hypothetical protein
MLVFRILAWTADRAFQMGLEDSLVNVHLVLLVNDVKFEMHVKVILAWTEEHVNLSMGMEDINVYVRLGIVVHDVKQVRLSIGPQFLLFRC